MRDRDHRRPRSLHELPPVAVETTIGIERQLIAFNGMRNDGRLFGVGAHPPHVIRDRPVEWRRLGRAHRRSGTGQSRNIRQRRGERREDERAAERCDQKLGGRPHAGTILTAHFLKSVCFEIGSVASRVALLMSWLASNQGTNTTPRGILLRPRVSTLVRISPRREMSRISAPWLRPARPGVVGVHEAARPGKRLVELRHAHRHRAGMPVLQHPPGDEPEIIFLVRRLRRGLVGNRENDRTLVGPAVELDARARGHIGIVAFAVTPERLLPVDHRPAKAAVLVIGIERRKVVTVAAPEGGVFLEQPLVHVEAEMLCLIVGVCRVDVAEREPVDVAVPEQHVEKRTYRAGRDWRRGSRRARPHRS